MHTNTDNMANICDPLDKVLSLIKELKNTNLNTRRGSTHDNIFDQMNECINEAKNNIILRLLNEQKNENISISSNKPVTFASVAANKKPSNSIIVPVGNDKPNNASIIEIEKNVCKILKDSHSNATIVKTQSTDNGNVVIQFAPDDKLDNLKDKFSNQLGDNIKIKSPMWPKIKITGIPAYLDTSNKKEIHSSIMDQNNWLKDALNTDNKSFEIIFSYNAKETKSLVCKCSPDLRKLINEHGDFLKIEHKQCKIYNHVHVTQCSKCCSFGHSVGKCNANVVCTYCAEPHSYKNCPHNTDLSKHTCFNCKSSKSAEIQAQSSGHHSFSSKCPLRIKIISRLINQTDWGTQPPSDEL